VNTVHVSSNILKNEDVGMGGGQVENTLLYSPFLFSTATVSPTSSIHTR